MPGHKLKSAHHALKPLLEKASRWLNQNEPALYLFDPKAQALELAVESGRCTAFKAARLALGEGVPGKVAQTLQPQIIHDRTQWEGRSSQCEKAGWSNAMAAPMVHQDKLYGVLALSDSGNPHTFSNEDLRLLSAFAEVAALTLANVALHEQALNSRNQLHALAEHSLVGIFITQDNHVVYANPRFAEMFGYTQDELMGRSPFDLIAPEDHARIKRKLQERFSGKVLADHYTVKVVRKDGSQFCVDTFASLIQYNGKPATQGMLVDITKQVEGQRLLRQLTELGTNILTETSIHMILEQVCDTIVSRSTFQTAAMTVFETPARWEDDVQVSTLYIAGVSEKERDALLSVKDNFGIIKNQDIRHYGKRIGCGYYLTPGAYPQLSQISVPLSHHPGEDAPARWGAHDTMYIFLQRGDLLLGRISLSAPRDGRIPTAKQLDPLLTLANLASLAIQNARQIQALNKQTERLQGLYRLGQELVEFATPNDLVNHVIQKLKADFAYDICAAMLLEGEELVLVAQDSKPLANTDDLIGTRIGLEQGVVGWVARHKRPRLLNDVSTESGYIAVVPATRSELCVPILFESNLLGVLNIESSKLNAFADGDLQLLSAVAAQLALALTNLQRYQVLKHQAIRDGLTGLYNRRHFNEILDQEVQRADRYRHPISVLFIDIDNMHEINSRYGHLQGDVLIKEAAKLLQETARATDIVFRYGGDEFVVLLPETNGQSKVLSQRIEQGARTWSQHHETLSMNLSIGVSTWTPDCGETLRDLVQQADMDMYRQKRSRE